MRGRAKTGSVITRGLLMAKKEVPCECALPENELFQIGHKFTCPCGIIYENACDGDGFCWESVGECEEKVMSEVCPTCGSDDRAKRLDMIDLRRHIQLPCPDDDFHGEEVELEECGECSGEGWVTADCFEDTCCCADPEQSHGIVRCICNPKKSEVINAR